MLACADIGVSGDVDLQRRAGIEGNIGADAENSVKASAGSAGSS